MKLIARQKIWLAVVVIANLALWIIPSDVAEQIARDRQTMLGRYSRTHFYWIVGLALVSVVSLYIDWSTGPAYRRRWFQVLVTMMLLFPMVAIVDYALRSPASEHYVREGVLFHHPANYEAELTFEDKPEAVRTFPDAPPGFGSVKCTLTTDALGYRNGESAGTTDVVVLGDSFCLGSKVSNEDTWPRRLAEAGGLSVYNLGMSSYDPFHYLESLKVHGVSLQPKFVICLLYEGNDFRSAKSDRKRREPSASKRLKRYLKQSPVLSLLDRLLIGTFAPIRADASFAGAEILDWMPLAIPQGEGAKYYAFAPKQLRDLYGSKEQFAADRHWLNPRKQLAEMRDVCERAGSRLIIAFAPTKAHVTLPLVAEKLDASKVRAYAGISFKKTMPPPDEFLATLRSRVEARESVVREWCQREGILFFSTTDALRRAVGSGIQAYYTYDQHWSPAGHKIVAEAFDQFLEEHAAMDAAKVATN